MMSVLRRAMQAPALVALTASLLVACSDQGPTAASGSPSPSTWSPAPAPTTDPDECTDNSKWDDGDALTWLTFGNGEYERETQFFYLSDNGVTIDPMTPGHVYPTGEKDLPVCEPIDLQVHYWKYRIIASTDPSDILTSHRFTLTHVRQERFAYDGRSGVVSRRPDDLTPSKCTGTITSLYFGTRAPDKDEIPHRITGNGTVVVEDAEREVGSEADEPTDPDSC